MVPLLEGMSEASPKSAAIFYEHISWYSGGFGRNSVPVRLDSLPPRMRRENCSPAPYGGDRLEAQGRTAKASERIIA
eukprot:10426808-Alexandrium_andersonii.AAC.1